MTEYVLTIKLVGGTCSMGGIPPMSLMLMRTSVTRGLYFDIQNLQLVILYLLIKSLISISIHFTSLYLIEIDNKISCSALLIHCPNLHGFFIILFIYKYLFCIRKCTFTWLMKKLMNFASTMYMYMKSQYFCLFAKF